MWMLDIVFNGHVTYDLPMTPKLILSSKLHYGISKPELRAKKHISRIAGTVLIADYFFFGGHFGNMQISYLNMQNLKWYLADLKSTGKNTIETVEKSLTDMFIRLFRIYPCLECIKVSATFVEKVITSVLTARTMSFVLALSKHDTFNQCRFNVGPTSETAGQH